ncbi:unnamed protein product [Mytilus edulis]|uniref:Uncharacterized protein n=1 Tax=Mytilus edulis TaxID=6550 RepID=A0A8S3UVT9_MYTED|nr:unnamed protein product [Mytilus edulis]
MKCIVFIPGEIKQSLVSDEDFHKHFANPYAYGKEPSKWPKSTILLYKYSSNATTKFLHIPENTWKRINNEKGRIHAELIMKEDLEIIQDYLTMQPDDSEGSYKAILSVEVILSYSPCADCSEELCRLKKMMDVNLMPSKTGNKDILTVHENLSASSLKTEVAEDEKIYLK